MSKQDKANEINTKSIVSGFISPSKASETIKTEVKSDIVDTKSISASDDKKLTYDAKKGKYNKTNNYTITFKIDADIDDYLKNIDKITFIESSKKGKVESITKTEFVNNLIRGEFYKLIGASDKDDAETINKKWIEYKNNNSL